MVRRGLLLVFAGLFWCAGVVALVMFVSAGYQPVVPAVAPMQVAKLEPVLEFPYAIPGTNLVAEALAVYEGLYLEDGSCEEVAEVAALVLRNDGDEMLETGQVCMTQAGRELRFTFRFLPAGASVLVLDENRSVFCQGEVTRCIGSAIGSSEDATELVTLRETGMATILVTNPGTEKLRDVRIYFKNYDPQSNMYLGGIAYEINIHSLAPGQTQTCNPWYYVSGQSRIVKIIASGLT